MRVSHLASLDEGERMTTLSNSFPYIYGWPSSVLIFYGLGCIKISDGDMKKKGELSNRIDRTFSNDNALYVHFGPPLPSLCSWKGIKCIRLGAGEGRYARLQTYRGSMSLCQFPFLPVMF